MQCLDADLSNIFPDVRKTLCWVVQLGVKGVCQARGCGVKLYLEKGNIKDKL